jgi:hypothetical protein
VPSSVWPGEDRDELSHLRTLVSLERVLGALVDQVLALSLELLDQLLLEFRKRVLIDSSSGVMRSWATPGCLFRGEGMHPYLTVPTAQVRPRSPYAFSTAGSPCGAGSRCAGRCRAAGRSFSGVG